MKSARVLLAVAAVVSLTVAAPSASATAAQFCGQLAANWDGTKCTLLITSVRKAQMFVSLTLPETLLDDAAFGPVLRDYYQRLVNGWHATGATTPRDSSASSDYQIFRGPGAVQSLIVHENFEPFGIQANNAYRSFTFDMASGRRLALGDLFKAGIDPLAAISAAAAAVLPPALDAAPPPHVPGAYPFTVAEWQPGPNGSGFSGDYRAFALASDRLLVFMPDAPMQQPSPRPSDRLIWSMDGGTVRIEIPLSALAESLRPGYGGTSPGGPAADK